MPNEDLVNIPSEWRDVLHPRCHGVIAVEGVRQGPGVSPARAWLGSAGKSLWPVNVRVDERGLAHTVAAFVANYEDDLREEAAAHLRSLLAVAPQEVYDEAVAALALLRGGSPGQRIAASYLVPDRHDWVGADLAERAVGRSPPGTSAFLQRYDGRAAVRLHGRAAVLAGGPAGSVRHGLQRGRQRGRSADRAVAGSGVVVAGDPAGRARGADADPHRRGLRPAAALGGGAFGALMLAAHVPEDDGIGWAAKGALTEVLDGPVRPTPGAAADRLPG